MTPTEDREIVELSEFSMSAKEIRSLTLLVRKTVRRDGCWLFPVSRPTDYIRLFFVEDDTSCQGHRFAFEFFRGPIGEGLVLDHLCRHRNCWNPWHCEPVTVGVNVLRGVGLSAQNVTKTECKRGHPLDDKNTYTDKEGHRHCRKCRNAASMKYQRSVNA